MVTRYKDKKEMLESALKVLPVSKVPRVMPELKDLQDKSVCPGALAAQVLTDRTVFKIFRLTDKIFFLSFFEL